MPFQDYRFLDAILAISAILFCVGVFGFLTRNRAVGVGLMLFAGALAAAGFGELHGSRSASLLSAAAIIIGVLRLAMVGEVNHHPSQDTAESETVSSANQEFDDQRIVTLESKSDDEHREAVTEQQETSV